MTGSGPYPGEGIGLLAETVRRQRAEIETLRRAMRTRGLTEMAKGVLVERLHCSPAQAFDHLARLSQEHNIKLVELAAFLVGERNPEAAKAGGPGNTVLFDPAEYARRGTPTGAQQAAVAAPSRYQLSAAWIETASSPDDLAESLLSEGLGGRAAAVALMALEPDGGLVLAGQVGLPAEEASRWRRVPPQMDTLLTRVTRTRRAIWVNGDPGGKATGEPLPVIGDTAGMGRARAVLPLIADSHLVGVLAIVWHDPPPTTGPGGQPTRRYVTALAEVCAHALRAHLKRTGALVPVVADGAEWFQAVLDALWDCVITLSPIRDRNGAVADFRIDYANAAAVDWTGHPAHQLTGTRLLELYPAFAAPGGLFDEYVHVLDTGTPYETSSEDFPRHTPGPSAVVLRAIRFLDGLLISWRELDAHVTPATANAQPPSPGHSTHGP